MNLALAYLIAIFTMFAVLWLATRTEGRRLQFKKLASGDGFSPGNNNQMVEYLMFSHALVIGLSLALGLSFPMAFSNAVIVPFILSRLYIWRDVKQKRKMRGQVESVLAGLSCSLYGNPSAANALAEVAAVVENPIKRQLLLANSEIMHGATVGAAMKAAAQRIDDSIFSFGVDGFAICRETGADVSLLFDRLASLARDRHSLYEKVNALTTQQKSAAKFVTVIPLFYIGAMYVLNHDYVTYLASQTGVMVTIYAVVSVTTGFWVMNRMADFTEQV